MLAHKAEEEAIAVIENITVGVSHIDYLSIPSVIYTTPEVAFIGLTEEQAKEKNIDYKVGVFPMQANSRARISNMSTGFVKLIANNFDEVIGAHIISYAAGEMITELTLGMEYKVAAEDIARTPHPHPSFSESIREAAMSISSKAIHI